MFSHEPTLVRRIPAANFDSDSKSIIGIRYDDLPRETSSSPPLRAPPPDYRPSPLRWGFLVGTAVATLGLIAAVAAACLILPAEVDRSLVPGSGVAVATSSSTASLLARTVELLQYPRSVELAVASTNANVSSPAITTAPTTLPSAPYTTSNHGNESDGTNGTPTVQDPATTVTSPLGSRTITVTARPTTPSLPPPGQVGKPGPATLPAGPASTTFWTVPPEGHGAIGPVTILPETGNNVVTVTQQAEITLETIIHDIVSTVTAEATINGAVATVTGQTTLKLPSGIVSKVVVTTTKIEMFDMASPSYVTAAVSTLTGLDGAPTATVTSTPPLVSTPTVMTLTDENGAPKATVLTNALVLPTVTVLTGSNGIATATVTVYPTFPTGVPVPQEVETVYYLSRGQYFIGYFLPPIASGLLSIPIRMIDFSAKQYQPWHELTRPGGGSARGSLCLRTDGIYGILSSVRLLAGGQALVFLTTLLTLCSAILVPLSAEAVALKLAGSCTETDFRGCAMMLGVFLAPARIVMGLLVFMVLLILMILVTLRRWRSGVTSDPWSIASIASLSMSSDVRALLRSLPTGLQGRIRHKQLINILEGKTFKLGYFSNSDGAPEYGIMVAQGAEPVSRSTSGSTFFKPSRYSESVVGVNKTQTEHHLPFLMLSYTSRVGFLLLLSGVMAVVGYYYSPNSSPSFDRFMDTQSFGVRALFTLLGVGITFFWSSLGAQASQLSAHTICSRKARSQRIGRFSSLRQCTPWREYGARGSDDTRFS